MAIIDYASFEVRGKKIFAYEYPEKNLTNLTQLNVHPGQEALFVLGGQIQEIFPPNNVKPYTLSSANLPVVKKLFGIPFGGRNPILASIWFINKADITNMNVVSDTFLLKDPSKPQGFPAICTANFSIRVESSRIFFEKLVNGNPAFSENDLCSAVQGHINRSLSEKIAQVVDQLGLSFAEVTSRLSYISKQTKSVCSELLKDWGLAFADFNVSITQDTSRKGMQMASGYGTDIETFERQRMLDLQEKLIDNIGNKEDGSMLDTLMAMTMMNNMAGSNRGGYGQSANSVAGLNITGQAQPQKLMVYCSNCSTKYSAELHQCPNCGKVYMPCPSCGADTLQDSKRCLKCGATLHHQPNIELKQCPKCGASLPADATFCSKCGTAISSTSSSTVFCPKCGAETHGENFCSKCGCKLK